MKKLRVVLEISVLLSLLVSACGEKVIVVETAAPAVLEIQEEAPEEVPEVEVTLIPDERNAEELLGHNDGIELVVDSLEAFGFSVDADSFDETSIDASMEGIIQEDIEEDFLSNKTNYYLFNLDHGSFLTRVYLPDEGEVPSDDEGDWGIKYLGIQPTASIGFVSSLYELPDPQYVWDDLLYYAEDMYGQNWIYYACSQDWFDVEESVLAEMDETHEFSNLEWEADTLPLINGLILDQSIPGDQIYAETTIDKEAHIANFCESEEKFEAEFWFNDYGDKLELTFVVDSEYEPGPDNVDYFTLPQYVLDERGLLESDLYDIDSQNFYEYFDEDISSLIPNEERTTTVAGKLLLWDRWMLITTVFDIDAFSPFDLPPDQIRDISNHYTAQVYDSINGQQTGYFSGEDSGSKFSLNNLVDPTTLSEQSKIPLVNRVSIKKKDILNETFADPLIQDQAKKDFHLEVDSIYVADDQDHGFIFEGDGEIYMVSKVKLLGSTDNVKNLSKNFSWPYGKPFESIGDKTSKINLGFTIWESKERTDFFRDNVSANILIRVFDHDKSDFPFKLANLVAKNKLVKGKPFTGAVLSFIGDIVGLNKDQKDDEVENFVCNPCPISMIATGEYVVPGNMANPSSISVFTFQKEDINEKALYVSKYASKMVLYFQNLAKDDDLTIESFTKPTLFGWDMETVRYANGEIEIKSEDKTEKMLERYKKSTNFSLIPSKGDMFTITLNKGDHDPRVVLKRVLKLYIPPKVESDYSKCARSGKGACFSFTYIGNELVTPTPTPAP